MSVGHQEESAADGIAARLEQLQVADSPTLALPQNRCLLFHIPSELRNRIYEDVLRREDPLIHLDLSAPSDPPTTQAPNTFAIIMTCRRILISRVL